MHQPSDDRNFLIESAKTDLPVGCPRPSAFLQAIHPISAEAMAHIDRIAFFCKVPKGKFIVKQGHVCPYLFLIVKGIVRGYMKDGNRELTTWISPENDLVSSISSFFGQLPSLENVQTLEDSQLVGIYYSDLQEMYQRYTETNVAARILLQKYYRDAEERAFISRLGKANDRYHYLIKTKPWLLDRVSLKIVASHLGITLETLSRMRSNLSREEANNQQNN